MADQFERTRLVFGDDGVDMLSRARVIVFGLGGVGSFASEALVRSGLGAIDIVDADTVDLTNLNRQNIALHSTLGRPKVDVAYERFLDINPDCAVRKYQIFYLPGTAGQFDLSRYDYIIDCIDTVTAKIELIARAQDVGVPIISCMGTGNKVDPTKLQVADISKTSVCPLARVMRRELAKRQIRHVKCVFSTEEPISAGQDAQEDILSGSVFKKRVPGSTSFVPSVAGLIIASEVVRDITGKYRDEASPLTGDVS
ncbi:MAG: tRNA threonylcarbamoyladenosine dehydratase [Spirochaetales bacterium]|nr:tRNA threonylcarbamoyladenosine dehydratase [Spirochaetales bacterium]